MLFFGDKLAFFMFKPDIYQVTGVSKLLLNLLSILDVLHSLLIAWNFVEYCKTIISLEFNSACLMFFISMIALSLSNITTCCTYCTDLKGLYLNWISCHEWCKLQQISIAGHLTPVSWKAHLVSWEAYLVSWEAYLVSEKPTFSLKAYPVSQKVYPVSRKAFPVSQMATQFPEMPIKFPEMPNNFSELNTFRICPRVDKHWQQKIKNSIKLSL